MLWLAAGCHRSDADAQATTAPAPTGPQRVTVAAVERAALDEQIKVVGTLFGREEVTLSAKVPGRLQQLHADIGDRIEPGAVIAEIEPTDYQLAVNEARMALSEGLARLGLTEPAGPGYSVENVSSVARARFQVDNARVKLERARQLYTRTPPLLSDQEFADLETQFEVARSDYEVAKLDAQTQLAVARTRQGELETAQQRLADVKVKTPDAESLALADGDRYAVTRRNVSIGEYVTIGTPLFDLLLDDPIKFRAAVPEPELARVAIGQPVEVTVASYETRFRGEIARINPAINLQNRMFEIEIEVPNADGRLRPGAFATGFIVVGRREDVPFVPAPAVVTFAGVNRVYSVQDNKVVEHAVEPGEPREDGMVPILKGLDDAETVIVSGNSDIENGDALEIVESVEDVQTPLPAHDAPTTDTAKPAGDGNQRRGA